MTEDKNINKTTPQSEEQEIDLIELAQKVWAGRKLVLKVCGVAVLVGLVVAFIHRTGALHGTLFQFNT